MVDRPSIFITGAARGIGRACAERFARAGYFVGLYDVDVQVLQGGDRGHGVVLDRVGDREHVARGGETVLAPKGIPHAYRVESALGARCLTITRGADFETMVRTASRPAAHPDLPAAAAPTPEVIEMLVRICADNQIEIVGAPLA